MKFQVNFNFRILSRFYHVFSSFSDFIEADLKKRCKFHKIQNKNNVSWNIMENLKKL